MILMIMITMMTMIIIFNEVINFLHLRRAYQLPTHLAQIKLWFFRKLINWFTFHDRRETQKYYKHQDKARKLPDKYMSLITDGMDSSKTNIPHFKGKSKVSLFQTPTLKISEKGRRPTGSDYQEPGPLVLWKYQAEWYYVL